MPTMQVFVSHAHADNELCDRYVTALLDRGLDVWYDRTNLQAGHSLSADIEAELRRRSAFVVMATPASLASQWVRSEIAAFRSLAAKDSTRVFLPVRAVECEMPLLWVDILWIDAVSLGFEAAVNAMALALGASAVRAAAAPTPTPQPAKRAQVVERSPQEALAEIIATPDNRNRRDPLERARRGEPEAYIELEQVIPLLEHATQISPRTAFAWSRLGEAYHYAGRGEDALAAFDRALALDDTRGEDWRLKSDVLQALGRTREAEEAFRRSMRGVPRWNDYEPK